MSEPRKPEMDVPQLIAKRGCMAVLRTACLLVVAGMLGCSVQWDNREAAREVAQSAQPPGSAYLGWRVFQDRCAACHGVAATGSASAPDLLPRVRDMGARRFVGLVLQRYDWAQPGAAASGARATGEALTEVVMARRDQPLEMPAWQGEPRVNAHILDLYAYLSARAEGIQGPGRPLR